jgi:hypothetical protein
MTVDKEFEMTTDDTERTVLLIGKSQLVLDESVASLRDIGYKAEATNAFTDITGRFDLKKIDLVVFGGQVPVDREAELREEIGAINPDAIFVQGLAGIPGLIVNQVQGTFTANLRDPAQAPTYMPDDRSIRLTLPDPADVTLTVWWQTAFVPPDPKSDSLLLLDDRLPGGDHAIPIPDDVPSKAAFATVQIDAAIYAFSIATEDAHGALPPLLREPPLHQ